MLVIIYNQSVQFSLAYDYRPSPINLGRYWPVLLNDISLASEVRFRPLNGSHVWILCGGRGGGPGFQSFRKLEFLSRDASPDMDVARSSFFLSLGGRSWEIVDVIIKRRLLEIVFVSALRLSLLFTMENCGIQQISIEIKDCANIEMN